MGDLQRRAWRRKVLPVYFAAALLLASIAVAIVASLEWKSSQQERLKTYRAYQAESSEKIKELTALQKVGWEKDLRAIAGRVFGARNLLYTIRALKQLAPEDLWLVRMETEGIDQPTVGQTNRNRSRRQSQSSRPNRGGGTAIVQSDTVIDAGSILVEGRVRDVGEQFNKHEMLRIWYEKVTAWQTTVNGREVRLFRERELVTPPGPSNKAGEWKFSWRFFLQPTQIGEEPLQNTAQLADFADETGDVE